MNLRAQSRTTNRTTSNTRKSQNSMQVAPGYSIAAPISRHPKDGAVGAVLALLAS